MWVGWGSSTKLLASPTKAEGAALLSTDFSLLLSPSFFFCRRAKISFCPHFWETRAFFLMPSDWNIACSTLFLTPSYPLSFRLLRLCRDLNHLLTDSNQIKILGFYFWDFLSWHSKKRNARWGGSSKIAILKVLYLLKLSWSSYSVYFNHRFHRLFYNYS